MACYFVVIFILLCCTSGSPVHGNREPEKDVEDLQKENRRSPCGPFTPWFCHHGKVNKVNKVNKVTADIDDAGEEYKDIEVNPNKRTELLKVPAQPGVDHSDTLRDSKQDVEDLQKENRRSPCGPFTPWFCHHGKVNKVNKVTADIDDAGEEYKEIEVNPNKRTELLKVPAQPGVDRSDTLRNSKQDVEDLQKENRRSPCGPFTPWFCHHGKIEQSAEDHKADIGEDLTKE